MMKFPPSLTRDQAVHPKVSPEYSWRTVLKQSNSLVPLIEEPCPKEEQKLDEWLDIPNVVDKLSK